MRFINFERTKLPDVILRHNVEEKKKYFADVSLEIERSDAEVQVNALCLACCVTMCLKICWELLTNIDIFNNFGCYRPRVSTTRGFKIWLLH